MSIIVQRSRLCVDFGVTIGIIHAIIQSIILKDPFAALRIHSLLINSSLSLSSALIGRKFCIQRELLPIPIGAAASKPPICPPEDVKERSKPFATYHLKKMISIFWGKRTSPLIPQTSL